MKIILAGQKRFGRAVLEMLIDRGHQVLAVACPVCSEPDKTWIAANNRGLPIIPAGTLNAETMPAGVDLILAAHSHDFIGRKTRDRARLGCIGFHPSLLPRHRGRDAVRWAIHMGEKITGGTVYWLNDTVDGGPIAAQGWCHIRPDDDARSLWTRELFPMGVRLLDRVLLEIAAGRAMREPQNTELATWEPAMTGQPRLFRPDLPRIGDIGLKFYSQNEIPATT